jgi:hypothetical protein
MISILESVEKLKFDYSNIASKMWRYLLHETKKSFNISFDLENNDATNDLSRDIIVPQNRWDFTKCKFRCQLCQAGGDWEYSVYYFKCQLIDGYAYNLDKYRNSYFVYIPGKTEGNYHLVKNNKDVWCAPHDGAYKKGIDPEPSKIDCWKSLNKYLKTLVDMEIERIKTENQQSEKESEKDGP